LVTNDDGIDSPGLWVLVEEARRAGLDVVVAVRHDLLRVSDEEWRGGRGAGRPRRAHPAARG
jgi:hypothetical protein